MSLSEEDNKKLAIKHYKRSHAGASSKELITEEVKIGSASYEFIQRMELVRLSKECFRTLDMRGEVETECKPHVFNSKTMWLDDESYRLFFEGLEKNNGIFTLGTYENIVEGQHTFRGMRAKMLRNQMIVDDNGQPPVTRIENPGSNKPKPSGVRPAAPKPNQLARDTPLPPQNLEVIPLGYFLQRIEDRVQRITAIDINVGGDRQAAKTRDISESGLLIKASASLQIEKGEHCEITFQEISSPLGEELEPLSYKVVRVDENIPDKIIALALDPPVTNTTTKALNRYIDQQLRSGRRAHKLELSDAILTARSMLAERFYVQSTSFLPFFLTRSEGDALHIQTLCVNENNLRLLRHFETPQGRFDLSGLTDPQRVIAYYQRGQLDGRDDPLIAVFRTGKKAPPQLVGDRDFAQQRDWLRLLAAHRNDPKFVVLKIMLRPRQPINPMRIVRETEALAEQSLEKAEQLIGQAEKFVAVGTLVDVTKEILAELPEHEGEAPVPASNASAPVKAPEILRMGYVEKHRREVRFLNTLTVELLLGDETVSLQTRDFSLHGLSLISTDPRVARLKVDQRIAINFPTLKQQRGLLSTLTGKKTSGQYQVVGVQSGNKTLVRMKLLETDGNKFITELLEEQIDQKRHKLTLDLSETIRAVKSGYYASMATESTITLPLFVFAAPNKEHVIKVGVPHTPGPLAEFFELEEHSHDFNPLSRPATLARMLKEVKKSGRSDVLLYMYKEQMPDTGHYRLHARSSDELITVNDRNRFLDKAIKHDFCIAQLVLNKAVQPPAYETDQIFEILKHSSAVKAAELAEETKQLIAVGDLVDVTRQLSGTHNFSN